MSSERYPNLHVAVDGDEVRVKATPAPSREPRCGPWDEQADGTFMCRKCGEVEAPGSGPNGY
jgi:hypothetical protein